MKEKILDFLKSNKAKTFYWVTAGNALGLTAVMVTDLDLLYAPLLLALITGLSKWVNTKK